MRPLAATLLATALVAPAGAQGAQLQFSGSALSYAFEQFADTSSGSPLFYAVGAEGRVRFGAISITARWLEADLDDPYLGNGLGLRTTTLTARVHPASWVSLGVEAQAQRFAGGAPAEPKTIWRLYGPTVGFSGDLGIPGLRATLDYFWFVKRDVGSETAAAQPLRGVQSVEASVRHEFRRLPVIMHLVYAVQWHLFWQRAATVRRGLLFGLGARWPTDAPTRPEVPATDP